MTEYSITLTKPSTIRDWLRLWRLYRRAFPHYERKPFFMILRTKHRGCTDVWCIRQNGAFAGLAITMAQGELVLLDYFAVSETQRGRGLGSRALRLLQQEYAGKRLFLEIESTETDAPNRPERLRRKQFYLRNGMSELGVHVSLFGVEMELLGFACILTFAEYQNLYTAVLGSWTRSHVCKSGEDFEKKLDKA